MSNLTIVKVFLNVFLIIISNVEVYRAYIVPYSYRLILVAVTGIRLGFSRVRFLETGSYLFESSFIESIIDKDSPFDV